MDDKPASDTYCVLYAYDAQMNTPKRKRLLYDKIRRFVSLDDAVAFASKPTRILPILFRLGEVREEEALPLANTEIPYVVAVYFPNKHSSCGCGGLEFLSYWPTYEVVRVAADSLDATIQHMASEKGREISNKLYWGVELSFSQDLKGFYKAMVS